jgi:hypothetical protein
MDTCRAKIRFAAGFPDLRLEALELAAPHICQPLP